MVDKLIGVLSVDDEVEDWLQVSMGHGLEVDVDHVPGIEHYWRVGWVQPLFVIQMDDFGGSHDKLSLVMHDNLVLVLHGDHLPMSLNGAHLLGVLQVSHEVSDTFHLWNLVCSVVLHLS